MYNHYKHGKLSGQVRGIIQNQSKGNSERREVISNTDSEFRNKKSYIYTEVLNISKRHRRMAIASESYGRPQTPKNVTELIEKYKYDIAEILPLAESEVEKKIVVQISESGFYGRNANIFDDISVLCDEIIDLVNTIEP